MVIPILAVKLKRQTEVTKLISAVPRSLHILKAKCSEKEAEYRQWRADEEKFALQISHASRIYADFANGSS